MGLASSPLAPVSLASALLASSLLATARLASSLLAAPSSGVLLLNRRVCRFDRSSGAGTGRCLTPGRDGDAAYLMPMQLA